MPSHHTKSDKTRIPQQEFAEMTSTESTTSTSQRSETSNCFAGITRRKSLLEKIKAKISQSKVAVSFRKRKDDVNINMKSCEENNPSSRSTSGSETSTARECDDQLSSMTSMSILRSRQTKSKYKEETSQEDVNGELKTTDSVSKEPKVRHLNPRRKAKAPTQANGLSCFGGQKKSVSVYSEISERKPTNSFSDTDSEDDDIKTTESTTGKVKSKQIKSLMKVEKKFTHLKTAIRILRESRITIPSDEDTIITKSKTSKMNNKKSLDSSKKKKRVVWGSCYFRKNEHTKPPSKKNKHSKSTDRSSAWKTGMSAEIQLSAGVIGARDPLTAQEEDLQPLSDKPKCNCCSKTSKVVPSNAASSMNQQVSGACCCAKVLKINTNADTSFSKTTSSTHLNIFNKASNPKQNVCRCKSHKNTTESTITCEAIIPNNRNFLKAANLTKTGSNISLVQERKFFLKFGSTNGLSDISSKKGFTTLHCADNTELNDAAANLASWTSQIVNRMVTLLPQFGHQPKNHVLDIKCGSSNQQASQAPYAAFPYVHEKQNFGTYPAWIDKHESKVNPSLETERREFDHSADVNTPSPFEYKYQQLVQDIPVFHDCDEMVNIIAERKIYDPDFRDPEVKAISDFISCQEITSPRHAFALKENHGQIHSTLVGTCIDHAPNIETDKNIDSRNMLRSILRQTALPRLENTELTVPGCSQGEVNHDIGGFDLELERELRMFQYFSDLNNLRQFESCNQQLETKGVGQDCVDSVEATSAGEQHFLQTIPLMKNADGEVVPHQALKQYKHLSNWTTLKGSHTVNVLPINEDNSQILHINIEQNLQPRGILERPIQMVSHSIYKDPGTSLSDNPEKLVIGYTNEFVNGFEDKGNIAHDQELNLDKTFAAANPKFSISDICLCMTQSGANSYTHSWLNEHFAFKHIVLPSIIHPVFLDSNKRLCVQTNVEHKQ